MIESYKLPRHVRVLLIEDDEDDYVLTRQMLDDLPNTAFELEWVVDADLGRAALRADRHDVCLLDYRLGREDGLELLREHVRLGFSGPVVMLTGQGDRETDILATELGAADFLVKGEFDGPGLERTIRYALAQRRMERERVQNLRDQQARREAESANRAKDEFLAMVAHELRSPLQSMSLWSRVLQDSEVDGETVQKAARVIGAGTQRLAYLVDDLLDMSRIVQGQLQVDRCWVSAEHLVADTVEALRPRAEGAGLELELEPLPHACEIEADSRRLQQVVENLIINAIKFTPRGGRISVALTRESEHLRIRVSDTGLGMDSELQSRIFERYQRGSPANSSDRQPGLGLGLAIVKHLVGLHGGGIEAWSPGPGKGSTFTVRLPLPANPRGPC